MRGSRTERGDAQRPLRPFGGQLTTETPSASATPATTPITTLPPASSTLRADAPVFQPGQAVPQSRGQSRPRSARGSAPRNAPRKHFVLATVDLDLGSRIHNEISSGTYECGICTDKVTRRSWLWSCDTCWTVFHLDCVKKWAHKDLTHRQTERRDGAAPPAPAKWRCPGCNLLKEDVPFEFICWCEKEVKPRPPSGCPPASCGQTCGRLRNGRKPCPHPCDETCHAGPCPPCSKLAPTRSCFCGKSSVTGRCVDTNYDTGFSCGQICGDIMPCGEHGCSRPCHEGVCGGCEVEVDGRCYCGKLQRGIRCSESKPKKESQQHLKPCGNTTEIDQWTGLFSCDAVCERPFDCDQHSCTRKCHPQDLQPFHCRLSPDVVKSCHCGKTALSAVADKPRTSCGDAIPSCGETCLRSFACGHRCQDICHSGECPPCFQTKEVDCLCGRTKFEVVCAEQEEAPSRCDRPCKTALNCGRHECAARCCPGEAKAAGRRSFNKQLGSIAASMGPDFEAEHICTKTCGRPLKCGNHTCPELCHKGACLSCKEAIFEEVTCHCGKTMLEPPVPCGTRPPPCNYPCERDKRCGHPKIMHNCHGDEQSCPDCPYLVEKLCMCGKQRAKNRPCFQKNVSCGLPCGCKLGCGAHECRETCHRPAQCEDASQPCTQTCGKLKKTCGHPCEKLCHAPHPCKEDKPCQSKVIITCDCQHLKNEAKCLATGSNEGSSKRSLKCNDECARLERNRKLALALDIDPDTHSNELIPYSTETLRMYQQQAPWSQTKEKEFRIFAADDDERILRSKPLPPAQRAFVHALAADFGLDSESIDPEPHRHVCLFKTPRFVSMPMKTLAECVRLRNVSQTAPALPAAPPPRPALRAAYNGFLLASPMFALTVDELRATLAPTLAPLPHLTWEIAFLPSEQVVLKARTPDNDSSSTEPSLSPDGLESALRALKPDLAAAVGAKHLAASTALCALDASLNVLRTDRDAAEGGWNVVARSRPARREDPPPKPAGVVLGSSAKKRAKREERRRKAEEDEVVEDWFEAAMKEEEDERHKNGEVKGAGKVETEASADEKLEDASVVGAEPVEDATGTV